MRQNGFAQKIRHATKGGSTPTRIGSGLKTETFFGAFIRKVGAVGRLKNAPRVFSKLGPKENKESDLVSERLEKIIGDLVASERVQPHPSVPSATDSECHQRDSIGLGRSEAQFLRPPASDVPAASRYPAWKRALDVLFITLAAPIWLPLMFVVMLWIAFASRGPIFYVQERVGYRERRFMMFKFRTMHVNVETQTHERHLDLLIQADRPMVKLDSCGDRRLIRCGWFLRCAGLDELPQLVNVLRGEMSLVGPRPCTVSEFQRYRACQRERFNAPPGLTGYWQVNGKNKTTFTEMIAMDVFYTKHMTIWVDLLILLKTFPAILAQTLESGAVRGSTHVTIAENGSVLSGERSRSI
jgi:lipopolysaccharide/colanic/teichoic acid biosynthesis glycosyltransferase